MTTGAYSNSTQPHLDLSTRPEIIPAQFGPRLPSARSGFVLALRRWGPRSVPSQNAPAAVPSNGRAYRIIDRRGFAAFPLDNRVMKTVIVIFVLALVTIAFEVYSDAALTSAEVSRAAPDAATLAIAHAAKRG
jgi:hypothetical protein